LWNADYQMVKIRNPKLEIRNKHEARMIQTPLKTGNRQSSWRITSTNGQLIGNNKRSPMDKLLSPDASNLEIHGVVTRLVAAADDRGSVTAVS